jgi:transposase-like protein
MDFAFKTIHEFNDYFKDEVSCYQFLEDQRWNGVPVCPHCATAKAPYKVKARGKFADIPSYRCSERACGLPFTVRTGSIFEGSKVELRKWFQAAYELSISKKGISSVELANRIGVSQKTAWFINHRLRAMLTETNPELLEGIIEADECYVGGNLKNVHESKKAQYTTKYGRQYNNGNKTPVVGLLQRDGKVRTFVTTSAQANIIAPIMVSNVSKNATLITDAHKSYMVVGRDYNHIMVKTQPNSYITTGEKHTNNIEGYWSILKRGIIGTFHVVSPQHLQRYCDEFAHRYNTRKEPLDARFKGSFAQFDGARLKYRELTPNNPEPHRKERYNKKATS